MRAHVRTVIALIGLASSSAQAEERPSADVFGRIPQVQNVALTPDGKTVAWEDNRASEPVVVVLDLGATELRHSLSIDPGMKLRRLSWADDSTLLMDVSVTRAAEGELRFADEFFRTLAVDVTTGQVRTLLMNGSDRDIVTGASLLAARTAKPHTVTMATWDFLLTQERPTLGTRLSGKRRDSGWINTVFSVDTRTGEADAIEFGSQFTEDWAVDETGRPVARSEWEPSQGLFMILARAGLGWRLIHRQKDGGRLALVGLAADGRAILALGANGTARSKLWAIPLDGTGAKVRMEDAVRDVEAIIADTFTGAPLGVLLGGLRQETRWLDAKAESRAKSLARAFPQLDVRVTGRSASGERLLVHVEGPSRPPTYYLVDFGARKADIVGEAYPALANVPLGEVRAFTYRARDGAEIPAYLTLPPGTAGRGLPLVVLPHGGPESRDDFAFNWKAQFLATRGYAVLQPQFRGSTGFGEAHRRAGYRQWGGLMQDDITDGVRAMVAQGIADARRVCIVGASYGGYAALAGAAFTPALYACAVSINGIADLPALLGHKERQMGDESDVATYWRRHIGDRLDRKLAGKSPARRAAAIRAPILLIHGADDTIVPVSQAEKMDRALTKLGRPHHFVKLPGEDHWLSRSDTRVRVLAELESFLSTHLRAKSAG